MLNLTKIILAILLLLCLYSFPYGYYQLVRIIATVGFIYLAITDEKDSAKIIFVILALLFQPLFKISLGRELWNVVDVIVAIGLIVTVFNNSEKDGRK